MKNYVVKILSLYKIFKEEYKIDLLASASTFYMILLIIPLNNVGFKFDNLNIVNFLDIYKWGLLFLINIIFVGTRYLSVLRYTFHILARLKTRRSVLEYLKLISMVILFILILTTIIIISFGLVDIWNKLLSTKDYYLLKFIELLVCFSVLSFIVAIVYKNIVPFHVSYHKTLKVSTILALIWLIMSTIYQNLNYLIAQSNINNYYQIIIFLYFAYFFNMLILIVFVYNLWQTKNELNEL